MPAHPAPRADDLASVLGTVRSAYLLGIGGVGMSGAARLLAARGIEVRGSDADPGGAAARLAGVPLEVTGEATVLPDGVDLVVRSAAIGPGHPQRAAAEERGLRMWRYADLVGALMADRVGIAVAGCHGKTTTSSLVASALAHAGTDPSWLVGGTLRAFGGGARAGAGPHFVVESCEFDRSFHAHRPHVAIVTNVDEDHLDYYADLAEIQESFRVFAALLPSDGQLVVNDAHAAVFRGDARLRAPLVTYGFGDDAAWRVGEPELTGDGRGVAFSLTGPDGRTTYATVPMLGRHNALNAAGAIATLVAAGVDRDAAEAGVAAFGGVDIVVSNAGAAWQGEIGELDDAVLRQSFELNFFAHQSVASNAVRLFKLQGTGGALLFNTSKQAINPGANFGAYGLPKAATLFLSRQYALEYGKIGVRSNAVNADRIRSGLLSDEMISSRSAARGVSEKDYMAGNLLGLEVTADHVAQAFLHHALSERTTGDVTTVDGGNIAATLR